MTSTDVQKTRSKDIELSKVAELLKKADNVLILTHKSPDGDTLGSGYALSRVLIQLGKHVKLINSDTIPSKYDYLVKTKDFDGEPKFIVAIDVASISLFGDKLEKYADRVDLCIDHHGSNDHYAKYTYVDSEAAAACEILPELFDILSVKITPHIADCLYTGLATDTGCFRFSNTKGRTLKVAARLVESGADSARLNKLLFETVSKERLELEKMALETLEYHREGKIALMVISLDMLEKSGAVESETEGIPSIPAKIEGVRAAITIKEKEDKTFKISLRTTPDIDASAACAFLGGGGHACAAGCSIEGSLDDAKKKILLAVNKELDLIMAEENKK